MSMTPEDHQRIADAVADVETRTSAEIVCVITQECSDYREVPLAWAAVLALILPAAAFALGLNPSLLTSLNSGWMASHTSGFNEAVRLSLGAYAVAQSAVFLLVWLSVSLPTVRRALTPAGLRNRRVHKAALRQFVARGIAKTTDANGVLIFVSLLDRRVEVLADAGVHGAVPAGTWDKAVSAVRVAMKANHRAEGLVEAVKICGDALAPAFPPGDYNPDQLPNGAILI
jgi:putative membrane protein